MAVGGVWGERVSAGGSLIQRGKYREILRDLRGLAKPELSFLSFFTAIATNSQRSRKGKPSRRTGKSWELEAF